MLLEVFVTGFTVDPELLLEVLLLLDDDCDVLELLEDCEDDGFVVELVVPVFELLLFVLVEEPLGFPPTRIVLPATLNGLKDAVSKLIVSPVIFNSMYS